METIPVRKRPGLSQTFVHLSDAEYHAHPAVSSTAIRKLPDQPDLYHEHHILGKTPKPGEAFKDGSAFHCLSLQPDLFYLTYVCAKTFSGKGSVAARAEYDACLAEQGKEALKPDTWDQIHYMAARLKQVSEFQEWLESCLIEQAMVWGHPLGVQGRSKPDLHNLEVVVDLKSATGAHPKKFIRKARYDYRYDRQLAWYLEPFWNHGLSPSAYIIAVDKSPPYTPAIYKFSDSSLINAQGENNEAVRMLLDCQKYDHWLPEWAYKVQEIT